MIRHARARSKSQRVTPLTGAARPCGQSGCALLNSPLTCAYGTRPVSTEVAVRIRCAGSPGVSTWTVSFRLADPGHQVEGQHKPRADWSTTTMIATETISRVIGQDVYDESGQK